MKCECKDSTGWTTVKCCNLCGLPVQEETWDMVILKEIIEELGLMYSAAVRCKTCPFRESCQTEAKYPKRDHDGHLMGCDDYIVELAKERAWERLTGGDES